MGGGGARAWPYMVEVFKGTVQANSGGCQSIKRTTKFGFCQCSVKVTERLFFLRRRFRWAKGGGGCKETGEVL
jgi:hypothetical protein